MSDSAISILAGGATALIAFCFAVAWDLIKAHRAREARERALLANLSRELGANRDAITSDLVRLKTEQKQLADEETLGYVNPLSRLEAGAWQLLRIELPSALVDDGELLRRLEIIVAKVAEVNNTMDNRERFQIQHLAGDASFLAPRLASYDNILVYPLEDLMRRIDEAREDLAPLL
ncbi:MAG TPA: hypothetical protein VJ204_11465 [Solirubrobacterales bacterium]|nr:hypothetical protein [Solirubrobacterales bacterium]